MYNRWLKKVQKSCINICTLNRSINLSAFSIKNGHKIKNNEKEGARHKMQRFVQPWASGGNDPRLQRPTTLAGEPSRGENDWVKHWWIWCAGNHLRFPNQWQGYGRTFTTENKRCNGLKMICFKQKISSWVMDGLDFPAKHCDKKANDAALVVLASNCIRLETRDFFFRIGKIVDQNRTIDALVIARANNLKQKWSNQRPRSSSLHSLCFPYIPSTRKKSHPPATIAKSTTTKARWKDPGIWAMRTSKRGRLWNR